MNVFEEHHHYVSDQARVSAYRQALREVIKPSDVVLDFASGTGILGIVACEAGAARVYSVELTSLVGVARDIAARNGFQDRIRFIKGFSGAIELPEKVDVIVVDQIGFFGQSSGMISELYELSQRFLKPDGTVVPSRIDFWVAPVEAGGLRAIIDFWSSNLTGFDLSPMRELAVNSSYPRHLKQDDVLSEPHRGALLQLPSSGRSVLRIDKEFTVNREGTLHGIAGWFSAQLSPSVSMTNSPLSSGRMNRHLMVYPLEQATPVSAGDRVKLKMALRPADQNVSWTVEIRSAESESLRRVFRHSTLKGMPLCREDLARSDPGYIPKLSELGKAEAFIAALCDGVRSIREIEQEVVHRFPGLCPTRTAAATLVASVVSKYSLDGHETK